MSYQNKSLARIQGIGIVEIRIGICSFCRADVLVVVSPKEDATICFDCATNILAHYVSPNMVDDEQVSEAETIPDPDRAAER